MITIISWDYLNLTLANEYIGDVTIQTQVIEYNLFFLQADQPIRLQYSHQIKLLCINSVIKIPNWWNSQISNIAVWTLIKHCIYQHGRGHHLLRNLKNKKSPKHQITMLFWVHLVTNWSIQIQVPWDRRYGGTFDD